MQPRVARRRRSPRPPRRRRSAAPAPAAQPPPAHRVRRGGADRGLGDRRLGPVRTEDDRADRVVVGYRRPARGAGDRAVLSTRSARKRPPRRRSRSSSGRSRCRRDRASPASRRHPRDRPCRPAPGGRRTGDRSPRRRPRGRPRRLGSSPRTCTRSLSPASANAGPVFLIAIRGRGAALRMLRNVQTARCPRRQFQVLEDRRRPVASSPRRAAPALNGRAVVAQRRCPRPPSRTRRTCRAAPGRVILAPSPAAGQDHASVHQQVEATRVTGGLDLLLEVSRAGNQLPKSWPAAFGCRCASIGPQAQPKRPFGASPVPPGVLAFGNEQSQSVATARLRALRVSSVSRSL